jgi:hypothetical protein
MYCEFCSKRLRKCKYELVEDRSWHYSCWEKKCKKNREEELQNFLDFFKSQGIIVRI